MTGLIEVVLPVFLVTAAGYVVMQLRLLENSHIDGLNAFAQKVAIPCLLFNAALNLDLAAVFDPQLLLSFYAGNSTAFVIGLLGARFIFKRRPGEAVAIGFGALFSNSIILGLPIIERAFGEAALDAAFAVVSIHAPFCYSIGIIVMEFSRADGQNLSATLQTAFREITHNALIIGLALGFAGNLLGLSLPAVVNDGLQLVIASALPVALFGLGGVLVRYSLRRSVPEATMITLLSLILHPTLTFLLAHHVMGLQPDFVRGAVMTAAMAPGVSTYIFAQMYDRAVGAAASSILLATLLSVGTVSLWIQVLSTL